VKLVSKQKLLKNKQINEQTSRKEKDLKKQQRTTKQIKQTSKQNRKQTKLQISDAYQILPFIS